MNPDYRLDDPESLPSPALLVYPEIVARNAAAMIEMAGDAGRLRPHVKTHKMPELIRRAEALGISKHKCATIAEAEMVAAAGGRDVLLAYPLVGPNPARLARLAAAFPDTTFRAVVDEPGPASALSAAFAEAGGRVAALLDLDIGMSRTGIDPARADDLARLVADLPGLEFDGLHAYDGHVRDRDPADRRRAARPGIDAVLALRDRLGRIGLPVRRVVLGGTPTFPVHAALAGEVPGLECSPGTGLLHDGSYAAKFPDLPFTPAALLLTRVVSRPGPGRLCLDVGYKAVAADPQGDRLALLDVPGATLGPQSEEHLIVEVPSSDAYPPGTPLLAVPTHVCPTCALHREALAVERGRVVGRWEVAARDRVLAY